MLRCDHHFWPRALCLAVGAMATACASGRAVHVEPPAPLSGQSAASTSPPGAPIEEPIEPDRPDVTNGTHIVDVGLLQVESGAQYAHTGPGQHNFGTPMTMRVGLTEWLEARVGTDGFLRQTDGVSQVVGMGNVQLGAKLRLWADPGGIPVLSILPTINLPAASAQKGLGSGDPDYTLAFLTGSDLGKTSHIDLNYGAGLIGAGSGRPHFTQHLVSASFSHSVTEQLSPYGEVFWFSRQDPEGTAIVSADVGFIEAFTARFAVDAGVAFGLTAAAQDFSVFGGVSIVVGDVLGDHGVLARQRKADRLRARSGR